MNREGPGRGGWANPKRPWRRWARGFNNIISNHGGHEMTATDATAVTSNDESYPLLPVGPILPSPPPPPPSTSSGKKRVGNEDDDDNSSAGSPLSPTSTADEGLPTTKRKKSMKNKAETVRKKKLSAGPLQDSTPITPRQLESLVRLAEAKAKAELRAADAKDILKLFQSSLDQVIAGKSPHIIGSPIVPTKRTSKMTQAKQLASALQRSAEMDSRNLFTVNEIKTTALSLGLKATPEALLALLNAEGFLLLKGHELYKLTTATEFG